MLAAQARAEDVVKPLKAGRLAIGPAYQFELPEEALKRSVAKYGPYVEQAIMETMSAGRDRIEGVRDDLINVPIADAGIPALADMSAIAAALPDDMRPPPQNPTAPARDHPHRSR